MHKNAQNASADKRLLPQLIRSLTFFRRFVQTTKSIQQTTTWKFVKDKINDEHFLVLQKKDLHFTSFNGQQHFVEECNKNRANRMPQHLRNTSIETGTPCKKFRNENKSDKCCCFLFYFFLSLSITDLTIKRLPKTQSNYTCHLQIMVYKYTCKYGCFGDTRKPLMNSIRV